MFSDSTIRYTVSRGVGTPHMDTNSLGSALWEPGDPSRISDCMSFLWIRFPFYQNKSEALLFMVTIEVETRVLPPLAGFQPG